MTAHTVDRLPIRATAPDIRPVTPGDPAAPERSPEDGAADAASVHLRPDDGPSASVPVRLRPEDGSDRRRSADQLNQAQYDAVAATVSRRRSLTDSLQVAFEAAWDLIVAEREDHLAVRMLPVGPGTPTRPFGAPVTVSSWLRLIADAHQMRWELPDDQLALLVSAAFEGLTVDFLASGDPEPARGVLRVLAYQVGRYGRRPAKNQQH